MKLDILVPHYKEPFNVVKPLLDSIALQQGIDFDNVGVLIANDGEECIFRNDIGDNYPFRITLSVGEHKGVSATRNRALRLSEADYVMFCDCDDMFLNNYALHMIFGAMNEGFKALNSSFIEEQKDDDGNYKIIRHDHDVTFCHGKVYSRKFLIDEEIFFDEEINIHEDGAFNLVASVVAEEEKKYIETPFYLWKWNDDSTVRKDSKDFIFKTYDELMKTRKSICRQLRDRGFINEYIDSVIKTVFDSYYDFQKPNAIKLDDNTRRMGESAFKGFYDEFGIEFREANANHLAELMYVSRSNAYVNGFRAERYTLPDWLKYINTEVKPL